MMNSESTTQVVYGTFRLKKMAPAYAERLEGVCMDNACGITRHTQTRASHGTLKKRRFTLHTRLIGFPGSRKWLSAGEKGGPTPRCRRALDLGPRGAARRHLGNMNFLGVGEEGVCSPMPSVHSSAKQPRPSSVPLLPACFVSCHCTPACSIDPVPLGTNDSHGACSRLPGIDWSMLVGGVCPFCAHSQELQPHLVLRLSRRWTRTAYRRHRRR